MKRCFSLKRNKQFRYVYRVGKSVGSRNLALVYAKSKQDKIHVGFSVSKKIGNSVMRNRVKRRLREAFTPLLFEIKDGYNIIVMARKPIVHENYENICRSARKVLEKAELLKQNESQG